MYQYRETGSEHPLLHKSVGYLLFYAASNIRHVKGRNPGISLAIGKYGKMAGLKAENTPKNFYSMEAATYPISVDDMPKFSMYNAFREGSSFSLIFLPMLLMIPGGSL